MSRNKNSREDPYRLYRTEPLDVNDAKGRADLAMSPLGDKGQEIMVPKHVSTDELKDIADRTSHTLRGASEQQQEAAREFLKERGIEPGRKRFYSFAK